MRGPAGGWPEQTAADAVTARSTVGTVTGGLPDARAGRRLARADGRGAPGGPRPEAVPDARVGLPARADGRGPGRSPGGKHSPPVWGSGGYPPGITAGRGDGHGLWRRGVR